MSDPTTDEQTSFFSIADIKPAPDAETIAVLTAAIEAGWPRAAAADDYEAPDMTWRFSQRRWQPRQIPLRTWGKTRS